MKKKKIYRTALAVILAAAMTACAPEAQPSDEVSQPEPEPEGITAPEAEPEGEKLEFLDLDRLRRDMEPSAAIAGIFNLGYYDGQPLDDAFFDRPEMQHYLMEYPFMRQIGSDAYAQNEGGEIYCIVPADTDAVVTVTAWDDIEGKPGAVLYESETGKPFFVQGNVSDIMPNLSITIQDTFGNVLDNYHPFISLKDGALVMPDDSQPLVLDFTWYDWENTSYSFDLYVLNEAGTDYQLERVTTQLLDGDFVLQMLIEQRVLPDTVGCNQCVEEDTGLVVDFTQDFADYLNGLEDESELLRLSCVVNSYLSAFGCDTLALTVAGEPLTLDGQTYQEPMGLAVG